jgi:arsenate reductase
VNISRRCVREKGCLRLRGEFKPQPDGCGIRRIHGAGKVEAFSAGSRPSGRVNPKAIEAMKELGYDLTTHTSKGLDTFNGKEVEVAVTMGCGDECPLVLAKHRVDWKIPDPRDMTPDQFREVRNLIETKVKELIQTL